ncbi:MAG: hypothetical protein WBA54_04400 [Acidaminobacteraceae bacterium]
MDIKSWDYKKIANALLYFVFIYFIFTQNDNGSKYFELIKIAELCIVIGIYYYIKSKLAKEK